MALAETKDKLSGFKTKIKSFIGHKTPKTKLKE